MAEKRYLHLNLVANDINLHQGAYKFERAHGVPERGSFERLIEYGRFGDEGLFTALFVGDSLSHDVEGPRSAGMSAVLLDRKGRYPGRDAIHTLADLAIPGADSEAL